MTETIGSIIEQVRTAHGWNQVDLAKVLGWSPSMLSELSNGNRRLSAELAIDLARVCKFTETELLVKAANEELEAEKAKRAWESRVADIDFRYSNEINLPVRILIQRGDITRHPGPAQAAELEELGALAEFATAWRKSGEIGLSRLQRAWIGLARRKAQKIQTAEFNQEKFTKEAPKLIREVKSGNDIRGLQAKLSKLGVTLIYVAPFPNGKISGATFESNGKPAIAITGLGKRLDKVVFTLLHEAAHVARGDWKHGVLAHDGDASITSPKATQEQETDNLAQVWAFPTGLPESAASNTAAIARAENVDRSLVVGRLQFEKKLPWRTVVAKNLTMLTEEDLLAWT